MRILTTRRLPAPIALAATLLIALVVLFAWPQSAAAHDSLVDSDPAADSTVETLPSELTLTFSAALIGGEGSTEIVVTDAAGNDVADGDPTLDGAMVVQPLASEAAAGQYHVIWKVVSSDGHPTSGEFDFGVSAGTADETTEQTETPTPESTVTAAPAPTASASATSAPTTDDPNMTSGFALSVPWIIGAVVVLLIVAFIIFAVVRSRRRSPRPTDSDGSAEG